MFNSKKTKLFEQPGKSATTSSSNPFVKKSLEKKAVTLSGNGAKKFSTTGSTMVDQFGTVAQYRTPREWKDVDADMVKLWAIDAYKCLQFTFYMRMITRVVGLPDGRKTELPQRGAGLKHEGIFRNMWIHINYPKTFWKNITLFIAAGSWKDVITMLQYDLVYNGWEGRKLDWKKFAGILLAGLENPNTSELIKKYLPQIKAKSACRTVEAQADNIIAKWICSLLYGPGESAANYKQYRLLKSRGTAHEWQQLISQGKMLDIDFSTIHGRALAQLVSGKFLKNNGLEARYAKWIEKQPTAKFTGYVYELVSGKKWPMPIHEKQTIDAQFQTLVETAQKGLASNGLRPISVVDCSGSMDSYMYLGGGAHGKLRSIEVAMSSAIFFDEMLSDSSPFKNYYLGFSGSTQMIEFTGKTFTEKFFTSQRRGGGGTNFESVFRFLADFRRANPTVSESDIPNFIVCFSDGEFDFVSSDKRTAVTNVEKGRELLKAAGYSKEFYSTFGMCFVDLPNTFYGGRKDRTPKFETFGDVENVFYFSGYDMSPLAFLFGVAGQTSIPRTAQEMFEAAMNQELLNMLTL